MRISSRIVRSRCALVLFLLFPLALAAATYHMSPNGNDTGNGSATEPFATIIRSQNAAAPGDTIYIHGGTYTMPADHIGRQDRGWAYVIPFDKSGRPDAPIRYWAWPGDRPVFDFSAVRPRLRVHAFAVSASWLHIKGIEIIGVQVTLTSHTQSVCLENGGDHNIFENIAAHDGQGIGFYCTRGSHNLFLNCDSYRNYDYTSENGRGGNSDGFGYHPRPGAVGNIFRGCRAWLNSDDGFDCIASSEAVTFDNCWAFRNGYSPDLKALADGNGFKAGGYGSTAPERLPSPIPRHIITNCLAVRNRASGFYANHHLGGCDWIDNTAIANGTNFNMLGRLPDNVTDIPGQGHLLRGNRSWKTRMHISNLDFAKCQPGSSYPAEPAGSSLPDISDDLLSAPRKADGSLPDLPLPPRSP